MLWLPVSYTLGYIFFAMFTIRPLQTHLDYALNTTSFLNALGGWLRWFGQDNFIMQVAGTALMGVSQVCFAAPACITIKLTLNSYL